MSDAINQPFISVCEKCGDNIEATSPDDLVFMVKLHDRVCPAKQPECLISREGD